MKNLEHFSGQAQRERVLKRTECLDLAMMMTSLVVDSVAWEEWVDSNKWVLVLEDSEELVVSHNQQKLEQLYSIYYINCRNGR